MGLCTQNEWITPPALCVCQVLDTNRNVPKRHMIANHWIVFGGGGVGSVCSWRGAGGWGGWGLAPVTESLEQLHLRWPDHTGGFPMHRDFRGVSPVDTRPEQGCGGQRPRAMRQRILGSHTPPCQRRMVITTHSVQCLPCCTAAQTSSLPLRVAFECALAVWASGSARSHHPPTAPVSP